VKAGDEVRVRRKAEHVFDSFRGETARVLRVQTIGWKRWARLSFENGRETWLPLERLEPAERGSFHKR